MFDCTDIQPALTEALNDFQIERDDESCRVVTPFQHHNGDLIRIWIQGKRGDLVMVRDYGETFSMLEMYGVNPRSDANKPRYKEVHQQFNLEEGFPAEIAAMATQDELATTILEVIQAIQATSRLMYTHQTRQPSMFRTTVAEYLDSVGYDFDTNVSIRGETHEREFDIGINHREPNVLLDTIHSKQKSPLKSQVDSVMLNWHEIKDDSFEHGAIIDDVDGIYDQEILDNVADKLDYWFRWDQKEEITQKIPVKA